MPLTRLDRKTISPARSAVSALMVVRNEATRLPHVFAHHRGLGIDRFFVVDNGSTDGSRDWLLAQPDCHVFATEDSFREAGCGMAWINALLAFLTVGSWCLFIDADELLVYPFCETLRLSRFCAFLDATGSEGVETLMLDMYSRGPVHRAHYAAGLPFLSVCPHFDRSYARGRRLGSRTAPVEYVGGPRLRVFYPELGSLGRAGLFARRAWRVARLHPLGERLGLSRLPWGRALPPELRKVALLKVRPGLHWTGNHATTPFRPAPVTAALLHFKFFSDFHARAMVEAARGQHWDGAAEYARYCAIAEAQPDLSFFYEGSETYRSSAQLLALGHLQAPVGFPEAVAAEPISLALTSALPRGAAR